MFLSHQEDSFQSPWLVLTDEMTVNYSKFMSDLMAEVYNIFFQERLPRVFPAMKELLQLFPSKMAGDWFLVEEETIIRLYGFVHQPYVLLDFLTVRIFSLEFLRQKLTVEEEHILSFRKILDMKFP